MATYKLVAFAGVTLPIYNVMLEMPADAPSAVLRTANGYFDVRGTRRQFPMPAQVRMRAVVATPYSKAAKAYLIVNGGNRLVVNGGRPLLIVTQSAGQVREQMDKLRALIGISGTLTRVALAGEPGATQSLSARMLGVHPQNGRRLGPSLAEIELSWEAVDPFWKGIAGSASGLTMVADVGGNAPVRDATLTVTGTTASTRVTGPGIDFTFVGSGQTLVVSGWNATANGAPVAVTLNAAHTAESLVELAAGVKSKLTVSGATLASMTWNDKWV